MRAGITLTIALLFGGAQVFAADPATCRAIADDAERLACYDALGGKTEPPAPPAAPAPVEEPEAEPMPESEPVLEVEPAPEPPAQTETAEPPPVPEDLGAEALPDKPGEEKEPEKFAATVTRCGETVDGRYLFYFENGQVWKQANDKRLYFRDCSFDVTITKDFFGFKMQPVGEKKRVRIRRVR